MEEISTKLLVSDYINFRLQKQNLEWPDRPTLPPQPGRVARTMRALGEEFEQRYTEVFQQMCNQLHITPNTAHPTFTAIVNELFSDGVKWGRVVALFSFGGSLAVQCVEKEMPPLVDQIVEWVAGYVDNRLQSWITEHGGWVRNNGYVFRSRIRIYIPLCAPLPPAALRTVSFIHELPSSFHIQHDSCASPTKMTGVFKHQSL